jgi:hypothetical protein
MIMPCAYLKPGPCQAMVMRLGWARSMVTGTGWETSAQAMVTQAWQAVG